MSYLVFITVMLLHPTSSGLQSANVGPLKDSRSKSTQILDSVPHFYDLMAAHQAMVESEPSKWGARSAKFYRLTDKLDIGMRDLWLRPRSEVRASLKRLIDRTSQEETGNAVPLKKFPADIQLAWPKMERESDDEYRNRLLVEVRGGRLKGIFVNRYIFDVPESEPRTPDYDLFDNPITTLTFDGSKYYRLLPLHVNANGSIQLIGPIILSDTGPMNYDPLKEFDYFSTQYGCRTKWWHDKKRER